MGPSSSAAPRSVRSAPGVKVLSTGSPGPALGLRLLALAVVAGSGAFLPAANPARLSLTFGIISGALLGFLQYRVARILPRRWSVLFIFAQVAVWTYLLEVSGKQDSPLFVGYLLEIALAAAFLSRTGCLIAGIAGAAAYLSASALLDPPFEWARAAMAIGFIAVTVLLTWILVGVFERQQRQIRASQETLSARAENLAEELRLLGDYLNAALLALDDLGRVVSINDPGAVLLGVDCAVVLGKPWQEVLRLSPEGVSWITRSIAEGLAQRGMPLILERADGRVLAVVGECWTGPSAQGRRTYVLFAPALEESGESDPLRRLGEAVACVSHQIKNSLHALQGFASGIESQLPQGSARSESTSQLLRALHGLGELAEDVLAMSGAVRSADERVPLPEILSSAIALTRHPGAQVNVSTPPHEITVRAHRGQLVHALFNLIDNACRVTPPGQCVEVRIDDDAERAVVEILDHGPGLPPEVARANGRAPSSSGHGYGLLAARRFLEASGGELTFERLAGGATRCRVWLPSASPRASQPVGA